MGTMIQAQRLEEAAFRGSQFLKHPRDLRGNFDILNITQPAIVQAVQRQYLEAGATSSRPTRSTQMEFPLWTTASRATFMR